MSICYARRFLSFIESTQVQYLETTLMAPHRSISIEIGQRKVYKYGITLPKSTHQLRDTVSRSGLTPESILKLAVTTLKASNFADSR